MRTAFVPAVAAHLTGFTVPHIFRTKASVARLQAKRRGIGGQLPVQFRVVNQCAIRPSGKQVPGGTQGGSLRKTGLHHPLAGLTVHKAPQFALLGRAEGTQCLVLRQAAFQNTAAAHGQRFDFICLQPGLHRPFIPAAPGTAAGQRRQQQPGGDHSAHRFHAVPSFSLSRKTKRARKYRARWLN